MAERVQNFRIPKTASLTIRLLCSSRGLRLVRSKLSGNGLELSFEGLSGETYSMDVLNSERVAAVGFASETNDGKRIDQTQRVKFDGRTITVEFPSETDGYARGVVTLKLK